MDTIERGSIDFQYDGSSYEQLIKVVGVGGAGGNAVTKMYTTGQVAGVSFLLCNTDAQVLRASPVPDKITIGPTVTKGLGAGTNPERARMAAIESKEAIQQALTAGQTRMVFIVAGFGKGTGSGAAPVIGKMAMEAGLLTVGIVTIPFLFEQTVRIQQALKAVQQMRQCVDALLIINNQKLIDIYPNLTAKEGLHKADELLINATQSISDIVNITGMWNVDFADVETVLRGGGVAIINTGYASGPNRMSRAIEAALDSPLLHDRDFSKARYLLAYVFSGEEDPLMMNEYTELENFTKSFGSNLTTVCGSAMRDDLGDQIAVTILASGFELDRNLLPDTPSQRSQPEIDRQAQERERKKEIRTIEDFYGRGSLELQRSEPVSLSIDELDDDELLSIIETTPSIKRDSQSFERKRQDKLLLRPIQLQSKAYGLSSESSLREPWLRSSSRDHLPHQSYVDYTSASPAPSPLASSQPHGEATPAPSSLQTQEPKVEPQEETEEDFTFFNF